MRQLLVGHRQRERDTWRQLAQLAAWLLAPYSRRKLSADKLIRFPADPLEDAEDRAAAPPAEASRRVIRRRHG